MKSAISISALVLVLFVFALPACKGQQILNAATDTVHIYGNCGMCEKTIEKSAFVEGEAMADWDKATDMAVITYDSTKTTIDKILKRIAAAGYDNELYRAPDKVYDKLPGCCHYDRKPE
jgi:copper chaperone CopZ